MSEITHASRRAVLTEAIAAETGIDDAMVESGRHGAILVKGERYARRRRNAHE